MRKLIAMLLILMTLAATACADDVLRVRGHLPEGFQSALPVVENNAYMETDELLRQLLTRAPEFDVFTMLSSATNVASIMDKGFCLDLSGSEVIRDAFSRMHPAIADYFRRGDAIYAIPTSIGFSGELMCNEAVWRDLGYTEADVPKSFPAFLDFLETWIIRSETADLGVDINVGWDEELYDEHSYAEWLIGMLMRSYIHQAKFAGSLRFNNPELVELLERTRDIGEQIYRRCEPHKSAANWHNRELFVPSNPALGGWDDLDTWMIDMRINGDQPTLMPGNMWVQAVYAGTEHPEEAIRLIEAYLLAEDRLQLHDNLFLYTDAEPLPYANRESEMRSDRNRIALIEHRLAGDDTPIEAYLELQPGDYERPKSYDDYTPFLGYQGMMERLRGMTDDEVALELEEAKLRLEADEAHLWEFAPDDLDAYKKFAQGIIIDVPSAFEENIEASSNYYNLVRQFSSGAISARQLVTQLDQIAEMVEMENR